MRDQNKQHAPEHTDRQRQKCLITPEGHEASPASCRQRCRPHDGLGPQNLRPRDSAKEFEKAKYGQRSRQEHSDDQQTREEFSNRQFMIPQVRH